MCEGSGCPAGGGGDPNDPDESCSTTKTASTCITTTTSTIFQPATTWTTWSFSECYTTVGCSVTDASSTTTKTGTVAFPTLDAILTDFYGLAPVGVPINTAKYSHMDGSPASSMPSHPTTTAPLPSSTLPPPPSTDFVSCSHQNMDPGLGFTKAFCLCSGSTFPENVATQVTPYNSCGYTVMPTVTLGGNTLPATTNTAQCQVCSVVGGNNNVCTSLDNCTPEPTEAPPPPPAPTPSGSLCLVLWADSFIEGSDSFEYGAFKPGDACSNDNSVIIGGIKTQGVCDLGTSADDNNFKVCGKMAKFVNEGPIINDLEDGSTCALQLQIDGVNYPGVKPDFLTKPCGDITCAVGVAYGSSLARLQFQNVPICD